VTASSAASRVEVVVTSGCHLCDTATSIVSEVCAALGVGWRTTDFADLPEPRQREWREYVPVVLVDGAVHDIFRVDPGRLRAALLS
jgi:hypothetical protein